MEGLVFILEILWSGENVETAGNQVSEQLLLKQKNPKIPTCLYRAKITLSKECV